MKCILHPSVGLQSCACKCAAPLLHVAAAEGRAEQQVPGIGEGFAALLLHSHVHSHSQGRPGTACGRRAADLALEPLSRPARLPAGEQSRTARVQEGSSQGLLSVPSQALPPEAAATPLAIWAAAPFLRAGPLPPQWCMSIPIGDGGLERAETTELEDRASRREGALAVGGGALLESKARPAADVHRCGLCHVAQPLGRAALVHSSPSHFASLQSSPHLPPCQPPQPEALQHVDLTTAAGVRDFLALKLGSHRAARRLLRAAEELLSCRRLYGARGGHQDGLAAKCEGGDGEEPFVVTAACESQEGFSWDWAELQLPHGAGRRAQRGVRAQRGAAAGTPGCCRLVRRRAAWPQRCRGVRRGGRAAAAAAMAAGRRLCGSALSAGAPVPLCSLMRASGNCCLADPLCCLLAKPAVHAD